MKQNSLESFFLVSEGHAYGKDAGANRTVSKDLITNDGTRGGVHNGLSSGSMIIMTVHERLNTQGSSSGIVANLLMGDFNAVQVKPVQFCAGRVEG